MKVKQACFKNNEWSSTLSELGQKDSQLILLFGGREVLESKNWQDELKDIFPNAIITGCSTSGEILDTSIDEQSLTLTAVEFEKAKVQGFFKNITEATDSFDAGVEIANEIDKEGLRHVLVLSEGLSVNGSELVNGLNHQLPENVAVTGGLAGDYEKFEKTVVLYNEECRKGIISVLAFYGESLRLGFGSLGGWDEFGPVREVTRSENNVLFELDGEPALELYKRYLGDNADELPGSGLLYPLSVQPEPSEDPVVRTLLAVNEEDNSIVYAGDVPEGSKASLMKANFDKLVDGAIGAAEKTSDALGNSDAKLVVMVSCVGRKMVLKQRAEDELEGVKNILGDEAAYTGFYSYGEISPFDVHSCTRLHNQTMTITAFSEET